MVRPFGTARPTSLVVTSMVLALAADHAGAQTSVGAASSVVARLRGDARLVRARRASAAIIVDGRLSDAAWSTADVVTDFVQQRPSPGAPASERTEVRVLFDAQALYIAMRLIDAHPDSIIAPLGRRDYDGYGDWAHVLIDSYHDRRPAFHFAVNPAGTRRDGMISNDAEWQEDVSWDAVWDAATSRDSLGWTAEFRIPLAQLRFDRCSAAGPTVVALNPGDSSPPRVAGADCVWGIQFIRDLARRNERSSWVPVAPDAGGYVSRFGMLAGIDGIRALRRVELVPYSLARVTRTPLDRTDAFVRPTALGGA